MKVPFYLITGFLGSGKTTLLKRVLEEMSDTKRIAIIQNEFAATNTDGNELKAAGKGFKLVEVNHGSVFCVCMLGTFPKVLREVLATYQPEIILLEASGLSDPINILELVQSPEIAGYIRLEKIITIVDALNFERALKLLTRTRHQVMIADTILMNKADLRDDPAELSPILEQINPYAEIILTSYCTIDVRELFSEHHSDHQAAKAFGEKESQAKPDISAIVLKTAKSIPQDALERFVFELQHVCERVKGFVNLSDGRVVILQSVFGKYELHEVSGYSGPSEIVVFAKDLSPSELRSIFEKYAGR